MPTVLSAEYPLHVETTGDDRRPCLLLLNPLGTTLEFWDPMIDALSSRNWVVRFDMRGHGRSTVDVGSFDLSMLASDAVAVLDALDVPRAHVLGASMGAMVGATMAAEFADRVDRLVLASCGVHLGDHVWWEGIIAGIEDGGMHAVIDHLEDIFFSVEWREAVPDRLAAAREMLLGVNPPTYLAGAHMLREASLENIDDTIRASTLLIGGEEDPVFAHFPITDLLARIADAEAVKVGGARHRVLLEQPDVLAPLINEFLVDPDAH